MSTKTQSLIARVYRTLPDIDAGWGRNPIEKLARQCESAEREHRRGRPAVRGFTCADAARYFTIRYLHDYATNHDRMPTIEDVLDIRAECILAAAIVARYPDQLRAWVATVPAEFLALDYCEMVQS